MPTAVAIVWIVTLVVAYLSLAVIVPLLLRLVHATGKIAAYARETHAASSSIHAHLEALPVLGDTEAMLQDAHGVGGRLAQGAEKLRDVLATRASDAP